MNRASSNSHRNDVGELALRGKIPRNVLAVCRMEAKIGGTSMRVEHIKMLRSRTLRFGTPLRVGRTVRLDLNLLKGSRQSISKSVLACK